MVMALRGASLPNRVAFQPALNAHVQQDASIPRPQQKTRSSTASSATMKRFLKAFFIVE